MYSNNFDVAPQLSSISQNKQVLTFEEALKNSGGLGNFISPPPHTDYIGIF
jgi:hypothetical protein